MNAMKRAKQALSASVVLAGLLAWAGGRALAAEGASMVTLRGDAAPVMFAATEIAQAPRASEAKELETDSTIRVPRWQPHDFAFTSRSELDNPFQASFSAELTGPDRTRMVLPGFYDGNGTWKVRFSPTREGKWQLATRSSVPELAGRHVQLVCTPNVQRVHGGVRGDPEHPRHFVCEDGTRFFPMGYECDWLWALDATN